MFERVRFGVLICLLLGLPASASGEEVGAAIDAVAAEAAADADGRRGRVPGDETFQAGHTCIAPSSGNDAAPIVCEARINPVLPPFYFDLAWHMDEGMGERVVDSVTIRRQGETEPFQTFETVGSSVMPEIDHNGFETIDVNFDGYLDFRLLAQTTAGPNALYRNWLWSDEEMRFSENAAPALPPQNNVNNPPQFPTKLPNINHPSPPLPCLLSTTPIHCAESGRRNPRPKGGGSPAKQPHA